MLLSYKVIEVESGVGRRVYALRDRDLRITHKGFRFYEDAARCAKLLNRKHAAQLVANNWTMRHRYPRITAFARSLGYEV